MYRECRQVGYTFGIKAELKLLPGAFKEPRQGRGQLIYQIFRSHKDRKTLVERRLKKTLLLDSRTSFRTEIFTN